jgi:uncharacterized protein (TIGR00251 family)
VQGGKGADEKPQPDVGGVDGPGAAVRGTEEGTLLFIEVQPGSGRPGRLSYNEWRHRLRFSVGARAEEGKANDELIGRLAGMLGAAPASLRITSGRTDRQKTVLISGMAPDAVLGKLAAHIEEDKQRRRGAGPKGGTGL